VPRRQPGPDGAQLASDCSAVPSRKIAVTPQARDPGRILAQLRAQCGGEDGGRSEGGAGVRAG